jgi:hypothetical protein
MGGFYSFRVFAPHEVTIIENFVSLDEGMNTFNVHVNDLPHFLERLRSDGVRIDAMHHLDAPDASEGPTLPLLGSADGSG